MSNTTIHKLQPTPMPDWYDPYPEPNTMPRKWDLSQYGYTDEAAKAKSSKKTRGKQRRRRTALRSHTTRPDT